MRAPFCLFLLAASVRADVTLGPLFTDHAVLQREKTLPIWGQADPGEHVVVTLGGQRVGTTADPSGRWLVLLEPIAASTTPLDLLAEGKTSSVKATDLLIGDVWLCAGGSNLSWTIGETTGSSPEPANAGQTLIRQFRPAAAASEPQAPASGGAWTIAAPQTVASFSAVGYFFAREIQSRSGVPLGLLVCAQAGSEIEGWLSPASLATQPELATVTERWSQLAAQRPVRQAAYEKALAEWSAAQAEAKARGTKFNPPRPSEPRLPGPSFAPGSLFQAMIAPLLPCAVTGVVWYQGEANEYNGTEYGGLFTALIEGWRRHLGESALPFLWVQLANFKSGDAASTALAWVREGQAQALTLPNTGQAVAIDLGNPGDLHPKDPREIGRRLALLARALVYGAHLDVSGPTLLSATREGAAMRIRFLHAGTGLTAHTRPLQSFQIAGPDGIFRPATARIDGDSVLVSSKAVPEPVAVRYAFSNAPEANLYNGAGLPAAPFRTDR